MELIKQLPILYKKQGNNIVENKFFVYKDGNDSFVCRIFKGKIGESSKNIPQDFIVTMDGAFCERQAERTWNMKKEMEGYKTLKDIGLGKDEVWKALSKEDKINLINEKL